MEIVNIMIELSKIRLNVKRGNVISAGHLKTGIFTFKVM